MIVSGLNKLLLEPYAGKTSPTAEVKSGFATVKQRSQIIGLKLIADAIVLFGNNADRIPAGTTVYFNETELATAQWPKVKMKCADISDNEFVIANYSTVVALGIKEDV